MCYNGLKILIEEGKYELGFFEIQSSVGAYRRGQYASRYLQQQIYPLEIQRVGRYFRRGRQIYRQGHDIDDFAVYRAGQLRQEPRDAGLRLRRARKRVS